MDWIYQGSVVTELPADCIGFVYLIENVVTNRKYIGKKLAKFTKTSYKVVTLKNGTKKRKKIKTLVDSDWRDYWSSSDELKRDVAISKDNFRREILFYCTSKAQCSYIEAREQFTRKVLESDDYYNGQI